MLSFPISTADTDYDSQAMDFTLTAADPEHCVRIPIVMDDTVEPPELFDVVLDTSTPLTTVRPSQESALVTILREFGKALYTMYMKRSILCNSIRDTSTMHNPFVSICREGLCRIVLVSSIVLLRVESDFLCACAPNVCNC